jgi:hypothetical protein
MLNGMVGDFPELVTQSFILGWIPTTRLQR